MAILIKGSQLRPAAITHRELATNAVQNDNIADNAVDTAELVNGAVTASKLDVDSVTDAAIEDHSITGSDKLVAESVTDVELASGSVSTAKLADQAVTADKIENLTITDAQLDDGAVIARILAPGSVTDAAITIGTISGNRIVDSTITSLQIADGTIVQGDLDSTYEENFMYVDGTRPFGAEVDFGGFKAVNVDAPTAPTDATNKGYVDGAVSALNGVLMNAVAGLNNKAAVRAATVSDITLTGLQTIDGETLVDNNRVLVKDQVDATENGIYLAHSGAWTRALDAATGEQYKGAFVIVLRGDVNANRVYKQDNEEGDGSINIGTTDLEWTFISAYKDPAFLTSIDKNKTPTGTATSGQSTGVFITYSPDYNSYVQVSVNGIIYNLGDENADFWFNNGAGGARALANIEAGDVLHVGSGLGFTIDTGDRISLLYETDEISNA